LLRIDLLLVRVTLPRHVALHLSLMLILFFVSIRMPIRSWIFLNLQRFLCLRILFYYRTHSARNSCIAAFRGSIVIQGGFTIHSKLLSLGEAHKVSDLGMVVLVRGEQDGRLDGYRLELFFHFIHQTPLPLMIIGTLLELAEVVRPIEQG